MKNHVGWFASFLICMPLFSHAETFKCKLPDGSTAFQDHACPDGISSTEITLPTAPRSSQKTAVTAVPNSNNIPNSSNSGEFCKGAFLEAQKVCRSKIYEVRQSCVRQNNNAPCGDIANLAVAQCLAAAQTRCLNEIRAAKQHVKAD